MFVVSLVPSVRKGSFSRRLKASELIVDKTWYLIIGIFSSVQFSDMSS